MPLLAQFLFILQLFDQYLTSKIQSDMSSIPDSAFSSYLTPITPSIDEPSTSIASTSYDPKQQNSEKKPFGDKGDEVGNLGDLATELELMPCSITKELSSRNKGKQPLEDEDSIRDGNFSSMPSSS